MGNLDSRPDCPQANLSHLAIDEALLTLTSQENVTLYTLSDECDSCSWEYINSGYNLSKAISTISATSVKVNSVAEERELCRIESHPFEQFGVYNLELSGCSVNVTCEPSNAYLPILPCFFFYVILGIVWTAGEYAYRKWKSRGKAVVVEANGVAPSESPAPKKERLKSIDTFRGICIVVMIFVNYGGGRYYFFDHAPWNGLTFADLVFPWFLWIMGVCIPISIQSQVRRHTPGFVIFRRILKRSVYLFLIGLILGSGNVLEKLRIFGVLQRFAITYFIVANIQWIFSKWYRREFQNKKLNFAHDIIRLLPHWLVILLIILMHCLVTFLLPVAGCPTGYLGPGGRHMNESYPDCTGGSTGYIDRIVLKENHLYQHPTFKGIYNSTLPYDPEGIMGTFTSCLQVFLGVQAGVILLTYPLAKGRLIRWGSWGIVTGALAALLTKCSLNDGWIPVNKNLWSLSFVFVTSSFAFFSLSICYIIIDVLKWWSGAPFYYPGMNSILLYCGHQLTYTNFPFTWVATDMNTHGMQMVAALWTTTIWVIVSIWLFHIKFFLAL